MKHTSSSAVLACGAWLKNAACLLDENGSTHWSPVHGDLSDPAACAALRESVHVLLRQHTLRGTATVQAIAHDLHPDFYSTRLALELAQTHGVPAIGVQHHHAHIAAVVAEHDIDGPVIGIALDGVGMGCDGTAWGGELLLVDGARWQRLGHLFPLALPGCDRAAREPWRMAASALHALGRGVEIVPRFAPLVGEAIARGVQQMLERSLNCPLTSSAGRWFDAAASALGLSVIQSDEAQAAIALETTAKRWLQQQPNYEVEPSRAKVFFTESQSNGLCQLDLRSLFASLLDTSSEQVEKAAADFHLRLADALAHWATKNARERGIRNVCLGGGCFFNHLLRNRVSARLIEEGLAVHLPGAQGCGDTGLALGQAWVAARQLNAVSIFDNISCAKEFESCA